MVLDAIFVLVELLLDLSIIKLHEENVIPVVSIAPFTPNSLCFHFPDTLVLPVAGVSLSELGSGDIFHGGAGWKAVRLPPGVFQS